MIACFLSNISAKYYKNPSMLSRVIAKNVGDVFLRHSVYIYTDNFVKKCYVILQELHFSYYVDRKFCVSSS